MIDFSSEPNDTNVYYMITYGFWCSAIKCIISLILLMKIHIEIWIPKLHNMHTVFNIKNKTKTINNTTLSE